MRKGQTSIRNGIQDLLCPFDKLYITQGSNGGYSHRGSTAIDTTSGVVGEKRAYYAPCDLKCVAVNKNYAFVWWQSINKVRFANGKIAYATIMVGHDETINATVGMTIKQGVQLGNLGAGGTATGVHCHIEVSPTQEKTWIPNRYGVYILPNQIEFEDAFFMDNTEILLGVAPWKYLKDVPVATNQKPAAAPAQPSTNSLIQEDGIATMTVDSVQARLNGPSGSVVRKYNTGDKIRYYWKWVGNGHRYVVWKEGSNYIYLAVSGSEERGIESWATFSAPNDKEEPKQPAALSYEKLYDPEEEPNLQDEIIDVKQFAKYGLSAKVQLVDKRLYRSKCCYTMKNPKGIGVHNFGSSSGSPTAQNSADVQNKEDMNPNSLKSWHFQVDDKEIIQSLPMNRNSFSFGDGAKGEGNRNYISIEIMKDMPTDNKEAADKAQDNGALAIAIIYYNKGWNIKDLKKHQDFKMTDGSYKYCPHRILDNGWDKFLEQVRKHYDKIIEMENIKESGAEDDTTVDNNNNNEKLNINLLNKLIEKLIQLVNKLINSIK